MGKLHELLAVEGDLSNTASKIIEESVSTFGKRPDHFMGQVRTVGMFDESRSGENEVSEKAMVTTVAKRVAYSGKSVSKYYDAMLQKEVTNQEAKADLILDGVVVAADLPATFLLGLESRLKTLRGMYEAIPTLQPGLKWEPSPEAGEHVYQVGPQVNYKTEKTPKHKVMYEATKEHPAQIEKWFEDVPVGRIETTTFSGMVTPAKKSEVLARIDTLIRAVKKARQRANDITASERKIGKALLDYINQPLMEAE